MAGDEPTLYYQNIFPQIIEKKNMTVPSLFAFYLFFL